ncbi:hypothetical protein ACB092_11G045800 [Castanea dentata]
MVSLVFMVEGICSTLLHFRNSFSVSNFRIFTCDSYPPKNSWKIGTDCCGWDGVTYDQITGHVIGVDLSCSGLVGPIHPNSTLFSLHHLQRFGGFANMTHLSLTESFVVGNFTSEISHLSKLVSLDLSQNFGMKIETPSLKRLVQNLTHLTELVLDEVNMCSVPPNPFMNLSFSLTSLRLFECGLKGRFPDNIFHLPNLQLLDVGYNYNLTGSLPTYNWSTPLKSLILSKTRFPIDLPNLISNLKSLKQFYLCRCNFIGSSSPTLLPYHRQITSLDLSYNNLGGLIPWSLLNFEVLTYLNLLYNNFIGQLPEVTTNLTQIFSSNNSSNSQLVNKISSNLRYLSLSNNLLNGTIPSWVYTIPSLGFLYLDYNQFIGHIGDFQHNSLVTLQLNNNNLHGPLPLSISKLVSLSVLSISFNNLSGNVESKIFSKLKSLKHLDMSNSPLLSLRSFTFATDILPNISSLQLDPSLICNLSSLFFLDLSYNHLSNMIPSCLENLSNHLIDLDLQSNNLHGTIPTTFAKGYYLRSLKLNGNQLEGSMPQSLVRCRKLEVLDFGNNKINGTFPLWLETLPMLQVLILRSNNFHGAIGNPKYKFPFPNLQIIDLSHNEFYGLLPTNFFKYLKAMKNSNADNGGLKYMGDHLSSNKLIGEIPVQLVDLTSLAFLNLSKNHLCGQIPQGKQFNTFTNNSYTCGNDEGQPPPPSSTIQEDGFEFENGFHWKVVLLGYGCGFVFGLVLGYLVFSSEKPIWLVNIFYGEQDNNV